MKRKQDEPAHANDHFCLLHRIEPEKNIARFYLVKTGPSLLDSWSVIRFWGRIGGHQRHFVTACSSAQAATILAQRLVQRRLRRGYRIVQGNLLVDQKVRII